MSTMRVHMRVVRHLSRPRASPRSSRPASRTGSAAADPVGRRRSARVHSAISLGRSGPGRQPQHERRRAAGGRPRRADSACTSIRCTRESSRSALGGELAIGRAASDAGARRPAPTAHAASRVGGAIYVALAAAVAELRQRFGLELPERRARARRLVARAGGSRRLPAEQRQAENAATTAAARDGSSSRTSPSASTSASTRSARASRTSFRRHAANDAADHRRWNLGQVDSRGWQRPYSPRSAIIGSTRVARRAGM